MVGIITAIIFIPLLGAVAVWVWPQRNCRLMALAFNAISAACVLGLWRKFDATETGLQFVERHAWIPAIDAEYLIGVDGLSLLLVLLTSLIVPFAFFSRPIPSGDRGFCGKMLLMLSVLYGTFTAKNLFLWFLF